MMLIAKASDGREGVRLVEYHLYPPFFEIAPQPSFDEAWEAFCCDILNLTEGTDQVRRRTPPDLGVDLIYPAKRVAYQCKAVLHGKAGDLPVSKIQDSIRRAVAEQRKVGWDRYVLCLNVDPTGAQEEKIRKVLPSVAFLTPAFWLPACRKFEGAITERFRILVRIGEPAVKRAIDETFFSEYAAKLSAELEEDPLKLHVVSNRRKQVFELPASRKMSVDDLLGILRRLFQLPGPKSFQEDNCSISLSYALVVNDARVPLNRTLSDAGIDDGSIVTFWITMVFTDNQGSSTGTFVECITMDSMRRRMRTKSQRFADAEAKFTKRLDGAFDDAVQRISV